ncbi:MAG TPA: hypothetical protein VEP90_29795 [Methylomirabilota bacterium]|nr:hypothetical protein [Methylomirabilota bacterium]
MKRPGGEGYVPISQRLAHWYTSLRGKGRREQQPPLTPVEPTKSTNFKQAMVTYLADRRRLRQQGYLHTTYGEPSNISLADAYHNDLTALENTINDAVSPSAREVRKAGDVSKIRDHFEMFAMAHFSLPTALEIMDRKTREMQQNRRESSYNPASTVTYSRDELETVQMLVNRAGDMQLNSTEGWTLTRGDIDNAWTAIISKSIEPIEQAIQNYTGQGQNQGRNLIIETVDRIKRQLHTKIT